MATRASRRRVDWVPLYQCVIISQVVVAAIILDQRVYTTVYYGMGLLVETVTAVILLLGALACLFGILSGTHWFRPGADVRDSYLLEAWALVAVVVSMGIFWVGILHGGGHPGEIQLVLVLMAAVIVGLALKIVDFHIEVRRLSADLVAQLAGRG